MERNTIMPRTFTNDKGDKVTWNDAGNPTDEQLDKLFASTPDAVGRQRQEATNLRAAEYAMRDAAKNEQNKLSMDNETRLQRAMDMANAKTPDQKLFLMAKSSIPIVKEMLTSAGVVGVPTAIGEVAGKRMGGGIGQKVGGGVGGIIGSTIDEILKQAEDPNRKVAFGEVVGNVLSGVLQTKGAKRNAVLSAGIETIRSVIDEKTLPTAAGISQAIAMGYAAGKVAEKLTGKVVTPRDALLEYRYNSFRDLRKDGVVVNPELLGKEGTGIITTTAGSAALDTVVSQKNQLVWQALAREEIGMNRKSLPFRPEVRNEIGALVRPSELADEVTKASKPYRDVRAISEKANKEIEDFKAGKIATGFWVGKTKDEVASIVDAGKNLDDLKVVQKNKRDIGAAMHMGTDPDAYVKYQAAKELEQAIEAKLELAAISSGKTNLVEQLKYARGKLARIFSIEEATDSFGVVDIKKLEAMRETNSRPGKILTGNLKRMADFAEAFGVNAQNATEAARSSQSGVPVSFVGRQAILGKASAPASMGVPVLRGIARDYILDETRQNKYMKPLEVFNDERMLSMAARQTLGAIGREHPDNPENQDPNLKFDFRFNR